MKDKSQFVIFQLRTYSKLALWIGCPTLLHYCDRPPFVVSLNLIQVLFSYLNSFNLKGFFDFKLVIVQVLFYQCLTKNRRFLWFLRLASD